MSDRVALDPDEYLVRLRAALSLPDTTSFSDVVGAIERALQKTDEFLDWHDWVATVEQRLAVLEGVVQP